MAPAVQRVVAGAPLADVRALVEAHVQFERSDVVVPLDWAARADDAIRAGVLDLFVARNAETAVGYASLTRETATWTGSAYGHLDCLFVDAAWRGTGTGRALFVAALAHAAASGLPEVQWQTPAWNVDAAGAQTRAEQIRHDPGRPISSRQDAGRSAGCVHGRTRTWLRT